MIIYWIKKLSERRYKKIIHIVRLMCHVLRAYGNEKYQTFEYIMIFHLSNITSYVFEQHITSV